MKRIATRIAAVALGIGGIVLTAGCSADATTPESSTSVVVEPTPDATPDPWNGVPQCTDAIAEAGGICHGEPIADETPTPTEPSSQLGDAAPAHVTAPAAPAASALPACPSEDSDNCYWDAATMGNGTGTSFVMLNGVAYYPPATPRIVDLNGVDYPYVDGTDAILYCEQPLRVGIDSDDLGNEWAACM
jgi:hypothetical protein